MNDTSINFDDKSYKMMAEFLHECSRMPLDLVPRIVEYANGEECTNQKFRDAINQAVKLNQC